MNFLAPPQNLHESDALQKFLIIRLKGFKDLAYYESIIKNGKNYGNRGSNMALLTYSFIHKLTIIKFFIKVDLSVLFKTC